MYEPSNSDESKHDIEDLHHDSDHSLHHDSHRDHINMSQSDESDTPGDDTSLKNSNMDERTDVDQHEI